MADVSGSRKVDQNSIYKQLTEQVNVMANFKKFGADKKGTSAEMALTTERKKIV